MKRILFFPPLVVAMAFGACFVGADTASAQDILGLAPQRGSFKVQPRGFNPFDLSSSRITLRSFGRVAFASSASAQSVTAPAVDGGTLDESPTLATLAALRSDYRPPVRSPYRPPPR